MSLSYLISTITKKEWKFVAIITLVMIVLTSVPYLYGFIQTPSGGYWLGLHSLTPGDIHVYYSYIEQAKEGHFLFKDLHTSEPQKRLIFNIFWLSEGLIAKIFRLSNTLVFQLTRVLLIPIFLVIAYLFISYFFTQENKRKICFLFLCFSSGLGALASPFLKENIYQKWWYNWPLDLWSAESNTFLTLFQSPHFILSLTLIVAIFLLMLLAFDKSRNNANYSVPPMSSWRDPDERRGTDRIPWFIHCSRDSIAPSRHYVGTPLQNDEDREVIFLQRYKYSILAGIFALILFQFHPFHIPTIFGVLGIYLLALFIIKKFQKNFLKHFLILFFISLPSILYYFFLLKYDFITYMRSEQNVCLTPSWWITIISYGFLLIFAIIGILYFLRNKKYNDKNIFLIVWLIVGFYLIYSPFPFQRRLVEGLQVPMVILSTQGLFWLYNLLKQKVKPFVLDYFVNNKTLLALLFLIFFSSSTLFNLVREFRIFYFQYPQLYISKEEKEAFDWLKKNFKEDEVILTNLHYGNLIPGISGKAVYLGHGVETLFFEDKLKRFEWFFRDNKNDERKYNFLKHNNIGYIFYPREEKIGSYNPDEKDYLGKVFENKKIEIYKIKLKTKN